MIPLPRVIVQIIVFCAALSLAAQNYKSDRLKRAADVVGLQISADSLLPDTMMMKKARDGRNVYLRTDPMGNVEQIGVPLFSEVMRILQPSPVYDFLDFLTENDVCVLADFALERLDRMVELCFCHVVLKVYGSLKVSIEYAESPNNHPRITQESPKFVR